MKPIFFSDHHFNGWAKFNEDGRRLKSQIDILQTILQRAFRSKSPVFFGGDLFHTPSSLDNDLLSEAWPKIMDLFRIYPVDVYAISGNHDMSNVNSFRKRSPSYINTLANCIPNFHNLDFESIEFDEFIVYGLPYIHYNDGYMKYLDTINPPKNKVSILLNHTDYRGQTDTNGLVVGKGENIEEEGLAKFTYVFSGHIHKMGKVRKNIYSLGATAQQRVSDANGVFGYWILANLKPQHIEIIDAPKFRFYKDPSEIDNNTDYWVKESAAPLESEDMPDFTLDLSNRQNLVGSYMRWAGVKSQAKRKLLLELINKVDE